jgi:hypothetical protein
MNIRNISESDSEAFLRLCLALDRETAFMMLEFLIPTFYLILRLRLTHEGIVHTAHLLHHPF